jgi:hypothetical protein
MVTRYLFRAAGNDQYNHLLRVTCNEIRTL